MGTNLALIFHIFLSVLTRSYYTQSFFHVRSIIQHHNESPLYYRLFSLIHIHRMQSVSSVTASVCISESNSILQSLLLTILVFFLLIYLIQCSIAPLYKNGNCFFSMLLPLCRCLGCSIQVYFFNRISSVWPYRLSFCLKFSSRFVIITSPPPSFSYPIFLSCLESLHSVALFPECLIFLFQCVSIYPV